MKKENETHKEVLIQETKETHQVHDFLEKGSSIAGLATNQLNAVVGPGISSLPFSFSQSGITAGAIILLIMAGITDWSFKILMTVGKITGERSFEGTTKRVFGIVGYVVTCFLMFILSYFTCIAYLTVIGDTLPNFVTFVFGLSLDHWLGNRILWISFASLFIITPICMLDDISKLEKFSTLSILAQLVLTAVVIVECIIGFIQKIKGEPSSLATWPWQNLTTLFIDLRVFGAIGVFAFAFVTHHNSFLLFYSLRVPSMRRFQTGVHFALAGASSIMVIIGFFGCLLYQKETKGNILKNLPGKSIQSNIARLSMSISMMLTFPIEMFVSRHAFSSVLEGTILKGKSIPKIGNFQISKIWLERILAFLLIWIASIVSFFNIDLGVILELGGAFAAISLGYALPSLMYLKLTKGNLLSCKKIPILILLIFGIACFIMTTTTVIIQIFTGNE